MKDSAGRRPWRASWSGSLGACLTGCDRGPRLIGSAYCQACEEELEDLGWDIPGPNEIMVIK